MTNAQLPADVWVTFAHEGNTVHARVSERGGRAVVTDMYLHGPDLGIKALSTVSMTKIFALAAYHPPPTGQGVDPTLVELRQRSFTTVPPLGHRLQLARPRGDDRGEFYRTVARAYREFAVTAGRAVAQAIAREADVPITTAHRWVREARRRGYLPPGTKGRTG